MVCLCSDSTDVPPHKGLMPHGGRTMGGEAPWLREHLAISNSLSHSYPHPNIDWCKFIKFWPSWPKAGPLWMVIVLWSSPPGQLMLPLGDPSAWPSSLPRATVNPMHLLINILHATPSQSGLPGELTWKEPGRFTHETDGNSYPIFQNKLKRV